MKAELGPGVTHGSLGNATFPACSSGINHFHCDGYRRTIPAFPNHGIMEYQNLENPSESTKSKHSLALPNP